MVGPFMRRECIEPFHLGIQIVIDEKAQGRRKDERVVYRHGLYVGLTDQQDVGPTLAAKQAFERRSLDGLMLKPAPALNVPPLLNPVPSVGDSGEALLHTGLV